MGAAEVWWRFGLGFSKALFIYGRGGLGWVLGLNWHDGLSFGCGNINWVIEKYMKSN